jgi:predicted nucleic acid-binding Zn ribbon protein
VSQRRKVRTLAAAAVLLGAAVSACTDDAAAPKPLSSPSSSADPSPSGSGSTRPKALSVPSDAHGTSKASAAAFTKYWVEVLNDASSSGDTTALHSLNSRTCESCSALIDAIERVYRAGGQIKGSGWIITDVSITTTRPHASVRAHVTMPPQSVTKRRGVKPIRFKGGRLLVTFRLGHRGDSWQVNELERST